MFLRVLWASAAISFSLLSISRASYRVGELGLDIGKRELPVRSDNKVLPLVTPIESLL